MNKKEAEVRIKELRKVIDHHRYLYHVLDKQEISEAALDSLKHELVKLEEEFPEFLTADSPSGRVGGAPLPSFKKVRHEVSQWSFGDAFDGDEMHAFAEKLERLFEKKLEKKEKLEYVTELKIDGFKIVLTYERGILKTAATRGDGTVGEDVTANVRTIQSIPLSLEKPVSGVFEGEIWLGKKELERINLERKKSGEDLYANPRNVAAGTIRQLDPKIAASRKLDSFIYDIAKADFEIPKTQGEELELIKSLGFKINPNYKLCSTIDEVIDEWKKWQTKRENQDYWIDGLAVKLNSRFLQETAGYTGKSPRYAIAFKFPAEEGTTILEEISVQVGRTGVLTPVAHLRAVNLAGTTVTRATLHNEDEIKRLDVRVGETVIVRKAGDIIPEIISVVKELRPKNSSEYHFPKKCPVCDSPAERIAGESAYRCTNQECPAREARAFHHFVSKKAFNIEHLGPKIIDLLVDSGLVCSFPDIFKIKKEDISPLDRMGEKSAENIVSSIEKAKKVPLARLIFAIGISGVGEETAHDLASHFGDLEGLKNATEEELLTISGVGEVLAKEIINWFSNPKNKKMIEDLESQIEIIKPEKTFSRGPLFGKTVVLTGTLSSISRDEAKQLIRRAGGDISSSVSPKTDLVVTGENPGSKYDDAVKLGVRIIDERELLAMVG